MTGVVLTFREGCAQAVRLRVEARSGMTLDELYAAFPSWPRARVLRAVLDEHNAGRVALRTRRGEIHEIHPCHPDVGGAA